MKLVPRALRGALVISLLATGAAPFVAAPAHAVAPAGATTLLLPEEGATVGGDPTFSWTPVPGAVKYRVQVSRSELFDTTVYSVDTANVHATPPAALPTGALFWRVAPTDGGSGVGTFVAGSFTREWASAPVLVSPANDATLTYPTDPLLFTWQTMPGAQKYNVQIDDDVNFINPLTSTTTNNPSYTLVDPLTTGQEFYWRVQAVSGTVVSAWSESRHYRVNWPATPVLVSPASGASVVDVELEWTPVAGAASYQLQVSPNVAFTNNITIDATVRDVRYSPPSSLRNGSYFWRVRARDGKSVANLGDWSAQVGNLPAQFTRAWTDRPQLDEPNNPDMFVFNPTMSWTRVPHASHYELQVSVDVNFSQATIWSCYTNQTSFTPYGIAEGVAGVVPGKCDITQNKLPIGTQLYWRVRAIDAPDDTVHGEFSDPATFMFRHEQVPVVVGPAPGAVVSDPQLSWEPVRGVSRYVVSVFRNGDHITGSPFTTFGTSYTPAKLVAGTPYSWMVQTLDDQGRRGQQPGGTQSFTFQPVAAEATQIELLFPDADSDSVLMPTMSWTPVAGAKEYEVSYSPYGANSFRLIGRTESTSITATGLPPSAGRYEWRVVPYTETGVDLGGSEWRPFWVGDLTVVSGLTPARCIDTDCAPRRDTPRLSWTPVMYASGYHVVIANDPAFTNKVRIYKTQHNSLTPREALLDSLAGSAYYWFVLPCRDAMAGLGCGRMTGQLHTAGAFKKESLPVELISPAHGASVPEAGSPDHAPVTFRWREYSATNNDALPAARQGARQYRVQVSTEADFATLLDNVLVDGTSYTPYAKTYPEGPLYWRVVAIDGSGNELTRSAERLVEKATPALGTLHPLAGASVSTTPYFQWTPQPHAKQYELEVYKNGDEFFSPTNKYSVGASTLYTRLTAYTPTVSLPAGAWAWRVRRIDADGRPGSWKSGGVFTVTAGAPTPLSPADGTMFAKNDMVFAWSAVPGVAKYKFESSKSPGFPSPLTEQPVTVMTSWAAVLPYGDGPFYWRVKSLDSDGNVLAVSATRSFVRDGTSPTVKTKTPISAALISGQPFTVTFSEPVVGLSPTTFGLKVASTGTPVPGTVTPGVDTASTTATFKPSVLLTPGETYTASLTNGISDVNGNALVPYTWTLRTALSVDASSAPVMHYWDRDMSSLASGGGYLASRTAGSRVKYTFTGTSASILGRRAKDGGYAEVWLDGVKKATASFYASTTKYKQVVWSISGLPSKSHTVELRVLGTKPSVASSSWVYPDAFRYGGSTLEETSASVVQSHRSVALTGATGKAYALATHTASGDSSPQPYITMKFKGTGLVWRGFRSTSGGIAKVYVDNSLKATVDTYGTGASSPQVLWNGSGYSNATHTVKIVVTGAKRTTSKGYNVAFDSFSVA